MKLELALHNPVISAFEGLKVHLELHNDGPSPLRVPSPFDLTDALAFHVRRRGEGAPFRRMSGFTQQRAMTSARVDATPLLEPLPAGDRWAWDVDLSAYHYALPPGEFEIEAEYRFPDDGVHARSSAVPVLVQPEPLRHVISLRDAPVLEGLTLVFVGGGDEPAAWLRQHNAQRPLGAWYSEPLGAAGRPFLAAARFLDSASFEPTFDKWLVSADAAGVRAQKLSWGRAASAARIAPLPAGAELLPSAFYDEHDRLTVFLRRAGGRIEAHELSASGLSLVFTHDLPPTAEPPAIAADCDLVHVVTPWRGLLYDRLTHAGALVSREQIFHTRMRPLRVEIDAGRRSARAAFWDGPRGRSLELVEATSEGREVSSTRIDDLRVRGAIRELSFDRDGDGHFHLLAATSRGRLYYFRAGSGATRVAVGPGPFFPTVLARTSVYLGFQSPDAGYRFLQLRTWGRGPRIAAFEEVA